MTDAARKDIAKHREVKPWTLQIPVKIRNENEIVRRATREVDPYPEPPRSIYWGLLVGALVALLIAWVFVIVIWSAF